VLRARPAFFKAESRNQTDLKENTMPRTTPITPESWEDLLESVRTNECEFAGVTPFRDHLEEAHARALALKAVRAALETSVREVRQTQREALAAGKDAAIALRGFIKSILGTRNEKLLDYNMMPLGRLCRTRKKLKSTTAASRRKGRAAGSSRS
jgi:hypothetical protein